MLDSGSSPSASRTAPNILCRLASAQKSPINTGLRIQSPALRHPGGDPKFALCGRFSPNLSLRWTFFVVYPDSAKSEDPLAKRRDPDFTERMIRPGFLDRIAAKPDRVGSGRVGRSSSGPTCERAGVAGRWDELRGDCEGPVAGRRHHPHLVCSRHRRCDGDRLRDQLGGQTLGPPGSHQVGPLPSTAGPPRLYSEVGWIASTSRPSDVRGQGGGR